MNTDNAAHESGYTALLTEFERYVLDKWSEPDDPETSRNMLMEAADHGWDAYGIGQYDACRLMEDANTADEVWSAVYDDADMQGCSALQLIEARHPNTVIGNHPSFCECIVGLAAEIVARRLATANHWPDS